MRMSYAMDTNHTIPKLNMVKREKLTLIKELNQSSHIGNPYVSMSNYDLLLFSVVRCAKPLIGPYVDCVGRFEYGPLH